METLQNILDGYDLEDIQRLKILLLDVEKKKNESRLSINNIEKFESEYLKYIKNTFSEKYYDSVKSSFKHFCSFFNKEFCLKDISIKNIEEFKIYLSEKAPAGISTYFRTLKAAFNKAVEWEYISSNPFLKIKIRKKQVAKPRYLSKSELSIITTQVSNNTIKQIIFFSFYTGCRLSEIINLRWVNVDLTEKILIIGDDQFRTKGNKQRIIPMNQEVEIMLQELKSTHHDSDGYVFTKSNGFKYNKDYVSNRFKEACRKAEIDEQVHFHTLRHSFASNLANKGVPIIVIKELMGHTDISTTQIYSHTNLESMRAAIRKFDYNEIN